MICFEVEISQRVGQTVSQSAKNFDETLKKLRRIFCRQMVRVIQTRPSICIRFQLHIDSSSPVTYWPMSYRCLTDVLLASSRCLTTPVTYLPIPYYPGDLLTDALQWLTDWCFPMSYWCLTGELAREVSHKLWQSKQKCEFSSSDFLRPGLFSPVDQPQAVLTLSKSFQISRWRGN